MQIIYTQTQNILWIIENKGTFRSFLTTRNES